MKKIRNLVIGGLQQKIFNLVLITIVLVVGAYTAVLAWQYRHISSLIRSTDEKQQISMEELSSGTMDNVIEGALETSTKLEAANADYVMEQLSQNVRLLGRLTEQLFENRAGAPEREVKAPDPERDGETSLQLLLSKDTDPRDEKTASEIRLLGGLEEAMISLYDSSDVNACYVGLPSGVFVIADDRPSSKYEEDGTLPSFPVTERFWYTGAISAGDIFFSRVQKDPFAESAEICCSFPVYDNGELLAVVGADLFLDSLDELVESLSKEDSNYICILNDRGQVIFSRREGTFAPGYGDEAAELAESENEELGQFVRDSLAGPTDVRVITVDGRACYVSGAPLPSCGWAVISVVDLETTREPTEAMLGKYREINLAAMEELRKGMTGSLAVILALLAVILVSGSASALTVAKKIVMPLNSMTRRISALNGEDTRFTVEEQDRTGDEIEILAESFAGLSERTGTYIGEIKRITAEKERIGTELMMARSIQASQLPTIFPAFPDRKEFDLYALMKPAKEVGGDFYDFFLIDKDHLCMVIADVSGKGIPAALFMMISRILIKNRIQSGDTPGEALRNVNSQLMENNREEMFVTVWLGILEISTGRGTDANAGHEHPVIRRAGGSYEIVKYRHSPAVAVLENLDFKEHSFELAPGDQLFLYTDGVIEAQSRGDSMFGAGGLLASLNRDPDAEPEEMLRHVMDDIEDFSAGAEQFDDITMLCLRYYGEAGKDGFEGA